MKSTHLATALSLLASAAFAADTVPLTLELPKPLFVGTPVPVSLPNLEAPRKEKRPDFPVPVGTVNLSKGKTVTSSDEEPLIGSLDLITDGDKEADEGCWVELGQGKQWIQIDLGQPAGISAIVLWHFHSQARVYHDVVVQISDDPTFATGVTTIFNNDYDDSAKMGKGADRPYVESRFGMVADGKGTKGRYVRLYSNGNTSNEMNHYIEVEVFGKAG